jgi:hypothetical protein
VLLLLLLLPALPLLLQELTSCQQRLPASSQVGRTCSMVLGVLPKLMVSLYWYMGFWQAAGQQASGH